MWCFEWREITRSYITWLVAFWNILHVGPRAHNPANEMYIFFSFITFYYFLDSVVCACQLNCILYSILNLIKLLWLLINRVLISAPTFPKIQHIFCVKCGTIFYVGATWRYEADQTSSCRSWSNSKSGVVVPTLCRMLWFFNYLFYSNECCISYGVLYWPLHPLIIELAMAK